MGPRHVFSQPSDFSGFCAREVSSLPTPENVGATVPVVQHQVELPVSTSVP